MPRVEARLVQRTAQTLELGNNIWQLGDEDVGEFGRDYARILTEDIKTSTHLENGKRAGIRVEQVRPGSIAYRHGARTGDIVISINGHAVHSEQEAISFVKNNQGRYTVWEVVVLRQGRRETHVYRSQE